MKRISLAALFLFMTAVMMIPSNARARRSAAPGVCFSDIEQYMQIRTQLPIMLRDGSYYGVLKSWQVHGGFRIIQDGKLFLVDAKAESIIGSKMIQSAHIRRACVQGSAVKIALDNGVVDDLKLKRNGMEIMGYDLVTSDRAGYERATRDIH